MPEAGEGLPQSEKELSQEELSKAVNELMVQFKAQFENSQVKAHGIPLEVPNSDFTGFGGLGHTDDPRILMINAYPGAEEPYWRIDQSMADQVTIVKIPNSGGEETVTIGSGDHPSIKYQFLDPQYKKNPGQRQELMIKREAKNNPKALEKAKAIIADIPQVKK